MEHRSAINPLKYFSRMPSVICSKCRKRMENRGMRVNMSKTKVMVSGEHQKQMETVGCRWQEIDKGWLMSRKGVSEWTFLSGASSPSCVCVGRGWLTNWILADDKKQSLRYVWLRHTTVIKTHNLSKEIKTFLHFNKTNQNREYRGVVNTSTVQPGLLLPPAKPFDYMPCHQVNAAI